MRSCEISRQGMTVEENKYSNHNNGLLRAVNLAALLSCTTCFSHVVPLRVSSMTFAKISSAPASRCSSSKFFPSEISRFSHRYQRFGRLSPASKTFGARGLLSSAKISVETLEDFHRELDRGTKLKTIKVVGNVSVPKQALLEHPVLQVLHARAASKSKPCDRADPYKVALAIEGGGMRGCISAGMTAALKDLGMEDCFDVVYGNPSPNLHPRSLASYSRQSLPSRLCRRRLP